MNYSIGAGLEIPIIVIGILLVALLIALPFVVGKIWRAFQRWK